MSGTFLRFIPCPQCSSRAREVVEVDSELRARCHQCGTDLPVALGTEWMSMPLAMEPPPAVGSQTTELMGLGPHRHRLWSRSIERTLDKHQHLGDD